MTRTLDCPWSCCSQHEFAYWQSTIRTLNQCPECVGSQHQGHSNYETIWCREFTTNIDHIDDINLVFSQLTLNRELLNYRKKLMFSDVFIICKHVSKTSRIPAGHATWIGHTLHFRITRWTSYEPLIYVQFISCVPWVKVSRNFLELPGLLRNDAIDLSKMDFETLNFFCFWTTTSKLVSKICLSSYNEI